MTRTCQTDLDYCYSIGNVAYIPYWCRYNLQKLPDAALVALFLTLNTGGVPSSSVGNAADLQQWRQHVALVTLFIFIIDTRSQRCQHCWSPTWFPTLHIDTTANLQCCH